MGCQLQEENEDIVMSDTYVPQVGGLEDVELPDSLKPLVEVLAARIHDEWAVGRLNEGWSYGPNRDDEKKTNPCLVPYDVLPDSEKEYDRNTVLATLKSILVNGFSIVKD